MFDAEDVGETKRLDAEQREADKILEACGTIVGFGPEGWVPAERYEEAMTRSKQLKEATLAEAESEQEWAEIR